MVGSVFHHLHELVEVDFPSAIARFFDHFLYFLSGEAHVELVTNALEFRDINVASFADVDKFKGHFHLFFEIRVHKFPVITKISPFEQRLKLSILNVAVAVLVDFGQQI